MRGFILYLALIGLALVVVAISFVILRTLHWSVLSYLVIVPTWITVLTVLAMVARGTFRGSKSGSIH